MNRFVIAETDKCIGCRTCEVACVLAHPSGAENDLTPENFHPRLKVVKGLTMSAPVQCHHCENAPCVNVCPTNALVYRDNTVQLIQDRCIGCQSCVLACPFGAMQIVTRPVKQAALGPLSVRKTVRVAHKCDFCIDVPEGPQCAKVCPTKTLHIIDTGTMDEKISQKREKSAFSLPPDAFR